MSRTGLRNLIFSILVLVAAPPLGGLLVLALSTVQAPSGDGFFDLLPMVLPLSYLLAWPSAIIAAIAGAIAMEVVPGLVVRLLVIAFIGALATGIGLTITGMQGGLPPSANWSPPILACGAAVAAICAALAEWWVPRSSPWAS